jgi:hypothetical protein
LISVSIRGITAAQLQAFPGSINQYSSPPAVAARFDNATFDELAPVEAWLTEQPGLKSWFMAAGKSMPKSLVNADSILGISIRPYKFAEWAEPLQETARCGTCPYGFSHLLDVSPQNLLLLERPPTSDLICVGGRHTICASDRFLSAIRKAELDSGLKAFPVDSMGDERAWFVLRPEANLAHAPQPFGIWQQDCPECGRRFDRYRIAPIFKPVGRSAHWMAVAQWPAAPLMVSGAVLNWLLTKGSDHLARADQRTQLNFNLYGAYPQHAGHCYVPRKFHAPDTVVADESVLAHMVFEEISVDPPVENVADPNVERGLFHHIEDALNWDHDIVYTLDLSGRKVSRLYGEDLAKFRNLNHLILRNTPITSVPDEVVGLPNLRTIDLTGTPNAEAEFHRLTHLIKGRGVKVIK